MQRLVMGLVLGVVLTTAILVAVTVTAQGANKLALDRSLVVDVQQAVPVLADVVVPLADGTTVNASVPLTLQVALQIAVDGAVSQSVQATQNKPALIAAAPAAPANPAIVQQTPWVHAGLQWRVQSAESVGAVYDDPLDHLPALRTENSFLVVQLAVENLGAASQEVDYDDDELNILLRDSAGRRFAWREHPTACDEQDLNPGLVKSCPLLFEVPRNAQGFSVIFATENGYEQTVPLGF